MYRKNKALLPHSPDLIGWKHRVQDSAFGGLLSNFRWYRRWIGGHWELWWIDAPVCSEFWLRRTDCNRTGVDRPGLAHGTPVCEQWPSPSIPVHPMEDSYGR